MPSFTACNQCWYCGHDLYSPCDTTNPPTPNCNDPSSASRPQASTATFTPSATTAAPTPSR
ncbi:hypothetical protein [Mycobacterium sp. 29Ha]|uniref:hypothetical protein n=1 Tax=Mycobacterium sp. 29Ha TaxID=2939268 RepID=UPI0029397DB2|nr:hypothetical protein [Mycobacterium sp. 29Ha]